MKTFMVFEKKGKLVRIVLSALFLTICSAFILFLGISDHILSYTLLGGVGVLFCLYSDVYLVGRYFKTKGNDQPVVLVQVDSVGVHDFSNKAALGLIKWSEIKSVKVKRVFFQKFVSIELKDEKAYYESHCKSPQFRRMLNRGFHTSPINITLDASDTKVEVLLQVIEERLAHLIR